VSRGFPSFFFGTAALEHPESFVSLFFFFSNRGGPTIAARLPLPSSPPPAIKGEGGLGTTSFLSLGYAWQSAGDFPPFFFPFFHGVVSDQIPEAVE